MVYNTTVFSDLDDLFSYLVSTYGKDLFLEPKKLIGLCMDLAPRLSKNEISMVRDLYNKTDILSAIKSGDFTSYRVKDDDFEVYGEKKIDDIVRSFAKIFSKEIRIENIVDLDSLFRYFVVKYGKEIFYNSEKFIELASTVAPASCKKDLLILSVLYRENVLDEIIQASKEGRNLKKEIDIPLTNPIIRNNVHRVTYIIESFLKIFLDKITVWDVTNLEQEPQPENKLMKGFKNFFDKLPGKSIFSR